jgi:peptidoglycan/xylan/chitin deacetylase (PgdA/CDA1 family)
MDFTIKKYKELISALKDAGYEFVTYAEYCEGLRADKLVVMRHDVDMSVERARRLAEVELEVGVKASYYFRDKFINENSDDIRYIESLGHEVGYHYEDLVMEKGDVERAYVRFMRNVCALRELVDVKTITMHGAPTSRFDSKEMWRVCDYKKLGLIGEPQFDVDWNDMFYLTDTGRSWNGVSRRDKVAERVLAWKAKGWVYEKTDDVIKALKEGRFPNRVMMTTHPQRWVDSWGEWLKELVMQKLKNIIKRFLIVNF